MLKIENVLKSKTNKIFFLWIGNWIERICGVNVFSLFTIKTERKDNEWQYENCVQKYDLKWYIMYDIMEYKTPQKMTNIGWPKPILHFGDKKVLSLMLSVIFPTLTIPIYKAYETSKVSKTIFQVIFNN